MEIDITRLVTDTETWPLSGSIATHGANAARMTWQARPWKWAPTYGGADTACRDCGRKGI